MEFVDPGNQNLALMTITEDNLSGGSTIDVTEVTAGDDGGTFTITFAGETTIPIGYNAVAATLESELNALSTITDLTVTGAGVMGTPW